MTINDDDSFWGIADIYERMLHSVIASYSNIAVHNGFRNKVGFFFLNLQLLSQNHRQPLLHEKIVVPVVHTVMISIWLAGAGNTFQVFFHSPEQVFFFEYADKCIKEILE